MKTFWEIREDLTLLESNDFKLHKLKKNSVDGKDYVILFDDEATMRKVAKKIYPGIKFKKYQGGYVDGYVVADDGNVEIEDGGWTRAPYIRVKEMPNVKMPRSRKKASSDPTDVKLSPSQKSGLKAIIMKGKHKRNAAGIGGTTIRALQDHKLIELNNDDMSYYPTELGKQVYNKM